MVKILPNGDIVPDDDPRAAGATQRRNPQAVPGAQSPNPGRGGNFDRAGQQQQGQPSLFNALNTRLLEFGIPRWNLGTMVVEPLVSVGLLLSMIFFGLPGILLIVILFVVSQLSQNGGSLRGMADSIMGRGGGGAAQRGPAGSSARGPAGPRARGAQESAARPTPSAPPLDGSNQRGPGFFGGSGNRLGGTPK